VSCFSAETTLGTNVGGGGVSKIGWGPRTKRVMNKIHEWERTSYERRGDKESPKACACLKSCEPLYTCPRAPFYRETKGLLHSDITLESKKYS
jgi:hypothetical protein